MTKKRKKPAERKSEIIAAALVLSEMSHYLTITREAVAQRIKIDASAIRYHFETMAQLRREIMRAAIKGGHYAVIAQGITAKDPRALKAPRELREAALGAILLCNASH